jgi:hypothetical protein
MLKQVLGPIFGLLLGFFLAVDFIIFGVIAFDSVLVLVVPVVGLLLGGVLAFTSPLGTKSTAVPAATTDAPTPAADDTTAELQDDSAAITSDGA